MTKLFRWNKFMVYSARLICPKTFKQGLTVCYLYMMTSNGNFSRVTGHLCGEFTGHRSSDCHFNRINLSKAGRILSKAMINLSKPGRQPCSVNSVFTYTLRYCFLVVANTFTMYSRWWHWLITFMAVLKAAVKSNIDVRLYRILTPGIFRRKFTNHR